jgi:acyl transferase domain-containing protein
MRLGQATAALVGGVNLTLSPDTPAMFTRAGEDGHLALQIKQHAVYLHVHSAVAMTLPGWGLTCALAADIVSADADLRLCRCCVCVTGMLSPEGRCKTLDASADGYVRAEAVGGLILEHMRSSGSQQVLAIFAGSSVNQDGRSSSLTAPNGPAQQQVLRAALTDAGLEPEDMSGLSMHGTGTPLGERLRVAC